MSWYRGNVTRATSTEKIPFRIYRDRGLSEVPVEKRSQYCVPPSSSSPVPPSYHDMSFYRSPLLMSNGFASCNNSYRMLMELSEARKAAAREAAAREAAAWEAAAWEAVAAWEAAARKVAREPAARKAAAAAGEAAVAGEVVLTAVVVAPAEAAAKIAYQALEHLFAIFTALWLSLYLFGGGIGSSSKKSLLAHDGWSEIWEIVLLRSGDVERNPGPTYITDEELNQVSQEVVGEDSLHTVFDEVLDVCSKWLTFCCCLGLRASLLEAITKSHHGPDSTKECLFDGLKHWVRKNYNTEKHGPPTWRKLVEAVDNSSGGENHRLALEIAERHKNQEYDHASKEHNIGSSVMVSNKVAVALDVKVAETASQTSEDRRSLQMSSAFSRMYRSIIRQMQTVDVEEVKDSFRYLANPRRLNELCVPPSVYEHATTTKDLLNRLCPTYVNPENTFVLEEIVNGSGPPGAHCKKELQKYTDTYF